MPYHDLFKLFSKHLSGQEVPVHVPPISPFKHKPVSPAKASLDCRLRNETPRKRVQEALELETKERREEEVKASEWKAIKHQLQVEAQEAGASGAVLQLHSELKHSKSSLAQKCIRPLGRPKKTIEKIKLCKSNRRMPGAPVLRRDPTAAQKLYMLRPIQAELKQAGHKQPKLLSSSFKQKWEATFRYQFYKASQWLLIFEQLKIFVVQQRLGLHGLRPFGSNMAKTLRSQAQGARMLSLIHI